MHTTCEGSVPDCMSSGGQRFRTETDRAMWWPLFLLVISFVFQSLTVFWGLNKGIDVTDEGHYLLCYSFPDYYYVYTAFHQIVSMFLNPAHHGIITYRIIRPVAGLLSLTVLAWGLLRFMSALRPDGDDLLFRRFAVWLYVVSSFFLGYCQGPQTFSYNTLNDCFLVIAGGLTLALAGRIIREQRPDLSSFLLASLAGFSVGMDFFVKATTALALFCCITGFIGLCLVIRRLWNCWSLVPCFAGGIGAAVAVFFGLTADFHEWLMAVSALLTLMPKAGPSPTSVTIQSFWSLMSYGQWLLKWFGPIIIAAFMLTWAFLTLSKKNDDCALWKRIGFLLGLLAIAGWFLCAVAFVVTGIWGGFSVCLAGFILIEAAAILAISLLCGRLTMGDFGPALLGSLFLGVLPLAGAFGTNNPVLVQAQFHMGPWFALMLFQNETISRAIKRPLVTALLFLIPICLACPWFFRHFVLIPFHASGPLFTQTEEVRGLPRLEGIKVDKESKVFFEGLAAAMRSKTRFQPGDMLMALNDMPGLVYLLEGKSPVVSWMCFDTLEYKCVYRTDWARRKDIGPVRVVLANEAVSEPARQCIAGIGVDFPGRYSRVASIPWPYWVVWPDRPTVDLYVLDGAK